MSKESFMKHFYEQDDVLYLARPIHRPPTAPHSHSFFEISYVKKGYRENISVVLVAFYSRKTHIIFARKRTISIHMNTSIFMFHKKNLSGYATLYLPLFSQIF